MSDFQSGHAWQELNDLLTDNSRQILEFNPCSDFDRDRAFMQLTNAGYGLITAMVTKMFGLNIGISWSGSFLEGSAMDPSFREQGYEIDLMVVLKRYTLDYSQQREVLRYLPDAPGYVKIDATEAGDLMSSLRNTTTSGLLLKPCKESTQGSKRYYLATNKPLMEYIKTETLKLLSDNIFTRTMGAMIDQEKRISCRAIIGEPASRIALDGISSAFKTLDKYQPKTFLSQFAGNVCQRFVNWAASGDNTPDARNAPREGPTDTSNVSFDFLRLTANVKTPPKALNVDVVLALECEGWPETARPYFGRKRNWPDNAILAKLRSNGFHLVSKPLVEGSPDSVEWRISFSIAESTLFHNMDWFKVYCYSMLKAFYYSELTLPKVLCSYHLKTIFLWTCERLPAKAWDKSNLAQVIMGLLDELLYCLVTKHCPHYFIPECNLFAHAHEDFLLDLARKVSEIRTHPERFPTKLRPMEKSPEAD